MDGLAIAVAGILVLGVAVAYFSIAFRSMRELRSIDDFFIFNKRLAEGGVFSATFAAEMSLATVFIAFMTLAAVLGIGLIWSVLTFVVGQLVLYFAIPAIKKRVEQGETLQTFLGDAYSSRALQWIASIVSVIGFVGLFSVEVIVGATLFSGLSPDANFYIGLLGFIAFLVTFYTVLGGFKSVVRTDKFQAVAVLLSIGVLLYCAFRIGVDTDGVQVPKELVAPERLAIPFLILNFLMINVLYPICDMSAWQRIAAARDTTAARRGFLTAVVFFALSWAAIVYASLSLTEFTINRSDGAALIAPLGELAKLGVIETLMVGGALAAFAAAMLSTGDTFLIAASQSLAMDVRFPEFFKARRKAMADHEDVEDKALEQLSSGPKIETHGPHQTSSTQVLGFARLAIILMGTIGIIACYFLRQSGFAIADFVFVVYGSTVAFAPVVIGAFWIQNAPRRHRLVGWAIGALVTGLIGGWLYGILAVLAQNQPAVARATEVLAALPGGFSAYNSPTVAALVSAIVYVVGLLATGKRKAAPPAEAPADA